MKNYQLFIGLATLLSLTACGGGGGGGSSTPPVQTITGKFKDTFVSGLNYKCSSGKEALTNAGGEYTCNVGDTVEFLLGAYSLGRATASRGIITPKTLYPSNRAAEVNVAQLLQSLNTGDAEGIITIPENFDGLDDVTIPPTDATFDASMTSTLATLEVTLVSNTDAVEHLQETYSEIIKDLVKGKTVYVVNATPDGKMQSITFSSDMSSDTWREILGGTDSGTDTVSVSGRVITLTPEHASDGGETITITAITDDYLVATYREEDDGKIVTGTIRVYFDEAKARAYLSL